jgi:ACT domain-containing protein
LSEDKQKLLDNLKQVPIVSVACQKTGISRASYYRWKSKDKNFSKEADKALSEGKQLINDLAESQLINAIKDQNMTGNNILASE